MMDNSLTLPTRWARMASMLVNGVTGIVLATLLIFIFTFLEIDEVYFWLTAIIIWMAFDFPLTAESQKNIGHYLLKIRTVTASGEVLSIQKSILLSILRIPVYFVVLTTMEINSLNDSVSEDALVVMSIFFTAIVAFQLLLTLILLGFNKPTLNEYISGTRVVIGAAFNAKRAKALSRTATVVASIMTILVISVVFLEKTGPQVTTDAVQAKNGFQYGGLDWMPISDGPHNWVTANAYCATTTIFNKTGWRLPTKDELIELYKSPQMAEHDWNDRAVWASTPFPTDTATDAHYIVSNDSFIAGDFDGNYDRRYVMCVSGSQVSTVLK